MVTDTIIIGAGITGITCARMMARAGQTVQLLDKGRGIGGRMATKRVAADNMALCYDHGAQYLRPRDPDFAKELAQAGAVPWAHDGTQDKWVGQPGMSSIPRALADGLHVEQRVEVTGFRHDSHIWQLETNAGAFQAKRVVLTVPAPQVSGLLGPHHPLVAELAQVRMSPCLTLLATFPSGKAAPFVTRQDPENSLAWIARDNTKPGRPENGVTWVAQARPDYSAEHLEEDPQTILAHMLPLLCDTLGTSPQQALHAQVHRWRYAQASQPLGRPYLYAERGLYIGGDWCLGPRAEDGWTSGRAMADAILRGHHAV